MHYFKVTKLLLSVMAMFATVMLGGCTTPGAVKELYEQGGTHKILMTCSSYGMPGAMVASWGAKDIYEARRSALEKADELNLADCEVSEVNGRDATNLGTEFIFDPRNSYAYANDYKVLLDCPLFGARVTSWGHSSFDAALEKALERADDAGLSPCELVEVNDGRYTLSGEPIKDDRLERIAASRSPEELAKLEMTYSDGWTVETFNIDLLKIVVRKRKAGGHLCDQGSLTKFDLKGTIGPDSTFAMKELFDRNPPCLDAEGQVLVPISVNLDSNGGFLEDGYQLGRAFRELGITVEVKDSAQCASSCAVAFLGGVKRLVQDDATIMFHAPYFTGENSYGKRDISCEIGDDALSELNLYYREMTDKETGDRLFDRTMWYCSAEYGWEIRGGSAAELYGIATEK